MSKGKFFDQSLIDIIFEPVSLLTSVEWIEANLSLPSGSSELGFGPIRLSTHWKHIINDFDDRDVNQINICSSVQNAKTTSLLCGLSWNLIKENRPGILISSDEKTSETIFNRLSPLLKASPIKNRIKWSRTNVNATEIKTDAAYIKLGWSSSPASMASNPAALVVLDEVAKFKSGSIRNEADAISLAKGRLQSYLGQNSKLILASTPVLSDDQFYKEFSAGIIHEFSFNCPYCDGRNILNFNSLKWAKGATATDIETKYVSVDYECSDCKELINEKEFKKATKIGKWVVTDTDTKKSIRNKSYLLSGLLSPTQSFAYLASEFLRSKDNPVKFQHFRNSVLGLPWAQKYITVSNDKLDALLVPMSTRVCPPDTIAVVAAADVGGQGYLFPQDIPGEEADKLLTFHAVILAVLPGWKFHVLDARHVSGAEDLLRFFEEPILDAKGNPASIKRIFIDSGYKTEQIYGWVSQMAGVFASDGQAGTMSGPPVKISHVDSMRGAYGRTKAIAPTQKANLNKQYFLSSLYSGIEAKSVTVCEELAVNTELLKHVGNVIHTEKKLPNGTKIWYFKPKGEGAPDHYCDAIVYALACAWSLNLFQIQSYEEATYIFPELTHENHTEKVQEITSRPAPVVYPLSQGSDFAGISPY